MKNNSHPRISYAFLLLIVISLACSSQVTIYETPTYPSVETLVAETIVVLTETSPSATATFVPTVTSVAASATPETFGEVYVYTVVENVNLRTNPGTLFQVSRVMPQNTRLLLLGQSPGGEWFKVMNDEGIAGWVNMNVLSKLTEGPPPPLIDPDGVILVTGTIMTELGTPVSGIGFSISQGTRSVNATTDKDGAFFAYLPPNMSGVWSVVQVAISCTSNTMDVNCNCINNYCGTAYPASAPIELPQREPLHFIWK
jgi:hypothetical protein